MKRFLQHVQLWPFTGQTVVRMIVTMLLVMGSAWLWFGPAAPLPATPSPALKPDTSRLPHQSAPADRQAGESGTPSVTAHPHQVTRPVVGPTTSGPQQMDKLPLRFETNLGQTDPSVQFLARGQGYAFFVTATENILVVESNESSSPAQTVKLEFAGAQAPAQILGEEKLPGVKHYLKGSQPAEWQTHVPTYERVRAREVYPGIDVVYYGHRSELEFDLVLQPGAAPSQPQLHFRGAKRLSLNADGELVIALPHGGELRQPKPVAYQEINGQREAIAAAYVLKNSETVGFQLAAYDLSQPLVIDPILLYASYLGGTEADRGYRVTVGNDGYLYMAGMTRSLNFPTANGTQSSSGGDLDFFVSKLSADGSTLLYSTYLGGSGTEVCYGLTASPQGNVWIAGLTSSSDMPVVTPRQAQLAGESDVYLAHLANDGSSLLYGTYFGGSTTDLPNDIVVDPTSSVYVTGTTDSADFPTVNAAQPTLGGSRDAFVVKLDPTVPPAEQVVFSTFLGGSQADLAFGIATDSVAEVSVCGTTRSADFPTHQAFQSTFGGNGDFYGDAFVTTYASQTGAVVSSTLLGGDGEDVATDISLDFQGTVNVAGMTRSTSFPTVSAVQSTLRGASDAFLVKLHPDNPPATQISMSTYLGGSGEDKANGLKLLSDQYFLLTGTTDSTDFPGATLPVAPNSGMNCFVAWVNQQGTNLPQVRETAIYGGTGLDSGETITYNQLTGEMIVGGYTNSSDLPTLNPVQATSGGGMDAFLLKFLPCPLIVISPASLPVATVNLPYSQTLLVTNGTAPYQFSLLSGALPTGLMLSAEGILSGVPAQPEISNFEIQVVDVNGCAGRQTYALQVIVNCPSFFDIQPDSLPQLTVGQPFSQTFTTQVGTAPLTFSVRPDGELSQELPPGLTMSPDGVWSGTPTTTGFYSFVVEVTDAEGCRGSRYYSVEITCPTLSVTPVQLPEATIGAAYSASLTGQGGTAPYTFELIGGSLPAGVTLTPDGLVSGTPTSSGDYTPIVSVVDSTGCTTSVELSLHVVCAPLSIEPATLPEAALGVEYQQSLSLSGGAGTVQFFLMAGALPTGLTLNWDGQILGLPSMAGSFTFTVQATDESNCSHSQEFTLTVGGCSVIDLTPTLPGGQVGNAYTQPLTAQGGLEPYSFGVVSGNLPPGIDLSVEGVLNGTPTQGGSFTFTVAATDASTCFGQREYTLTIGSCEPMTILPTTLEAGMVGVAYDQLLSAQGGTAPFTFTLSSGALPAGVTFSPGGELTGTPTEAGDFSFTINVSDATGCQGQRGYVLTVAPACLTITLSSALAEGRTAIPYQQILSASGGTSPYTFAVTTGALPSGLALSPTGTLAGTPTVAGQSVFTVTATDAGTCTGSRSYTLTITDCGTIQVTPATLPAATVGQSFTQQLAATGADAPYTFAVSGGTIAPGLTLTSAGLLTGTPTTAGNWSFDVIATDQFGCTGTQALTLTVAPDCTPLVLTPFLLPTGTVGTSYHQAITARNGLEPYTFAIASGALPGGLTLTPGGTLTGTPTTAGSFSFTVTATDAQGCTGSRNYTLNVVLPCPSLVVTPSTLLEGRLGAAYNQSLAAEGGTAPYTFTVTAGALPAGLTLSVTGSLSGTPTTAGSSNLTVTVVDAAGCVGSRNYTITVTAACQSLTLAPASLPGGTVGVPYSQTLTATGGTAPYSFAVTSGTLPAGLTLASNGLLSGTLASAGGFSFTITATDASGCTGTIAYSSFQVGNGTVRHGLTVNSGRIEGSLRVLLGEAITLNGGAVITHDLLVPGTPTLRLNGQPNFGGLIVGPGSTQPNNYQVTLNGNCTLGHLVNRIDPIAMPTVAAPPTPTGTRDVVLNSGGGSIGDPATLRNLTLNGNAGLVAVPPGTYGTFIANSGSGFILGVAGSSEPTVYNLQGLTLNGSSQLQVVGPVILTLRNGTSINSSCGNSGTPSWLTLRVATGGFTLNGGSRFYGTVIAPSGTVIINGNSILRGALVCDRLTLNGNGLWQTQ